MKKLPGLAQSPRCRVRRRCCWFCIIQAIGVTDLTKLIDANGMTALAGDQLRLYGILLAALLVFALSIGRKAERPDYLIQTPVEKRKLKKRTDDLPRCSSSCSFR